MVGLGSVPGIEAGMGCRCLLWRCSSEEREPGTGLDRTERKQAKYHRQYIQVLCIVSHVKLPLEIPDILTYV